MELGWQLDNPAIALGKYYEDSSTFIKKKAANEVLEDELSSKQRDLSSKNMELNRLRDMLESMGDYVAGDVDSAIQTVIKNAQSKIENETKQFESKKKALSDQKERSTQENDTWLRKRLEQLLGEKDLSRELTDSEKKALEFEIARRKFFSASNEKINQYQDEITQEQLDCQTLVGELKGNQDAIYTKYEPDLIKYKKIIDDINKKYQPDIRACQDNVTEKVTNRDEEIGQLQNEKNREIQLANKEIEGYQKEYKQTDRQFSEQIRMAKLQQKPTTRMENSRVSRLNAINDQIQKANNRVNKKVLSIDQKIETAQNKHAKIIEKAEEQLNSLINKRDQELTGPTNTYNNLLQDRDGQIANLQSRINQREHERDSKVTNIKANIEAERRALEKNNFEIDQQIIAFVMKGDTCFSDVLNEENAPFAALQSRVNTWMEMMSVIKKEKMTTTYPQEHEKQKNLLASKDYPELKKELAEASQYNDQLSIFAKNQVVFAAIGGALAGLGLVLTLLYAFLKLPTGLAGIGVIAAGLALVIFTIMKTKKEFSSLCKYVSLASDYQEFPCLVSHSAQVTQERELAKMKALGNQLYDVHYGRTEAQSIHDAKEADIKSDYERNLKLITKEHENAKAQIERDRDNEIKRIKSDAADGEENFNNEKENLKSQVQALTVRVEGLDSRIRELKTEIDHNYQFMEAFERDYSVLEQQLQNDKWLAPMSYTHGKLDNVLYIIPDNGECDECNHRKIYKIEHNKKALVVNYDISEIADENGYQTEQVNRIIHDLMFDFMYSVYRMNSKESYIQFVVDEMACTNDLKSTNVKNAFNIGEVAGKLEDIRGRIRAFAAQRERLAEKGTSMDALNESKFNSQDRPESYNILYIIYKPNERKSKLDDDIRMLIPECDKYGFLPVFICEKDTWEREIQERESIYKDIKSLTNNAIVTFNGKTYNVAI